MKAVLYHGPGDIGVDDVADARIEAPTDAVIRVTTGAICGTDLHLVRGSVSGMRPGTILGHEAVGIVEEVGVAVRGFRPGDRVVVCSTISCGTCAYCRAGDYAQCDVANPNGPEAGTSFFGGPETTGPIDGLQAEYARIPHAMSTLVRVPDSLGDDQAILCSDIFPTGYFGAKLAEVQPGDTVAVLGAGIVGQFAIASAKRLGAARVLVVDGIDSRLDKAREQNAEPINFNREDPIAVVRDLTRGVGADRVIDAVGVDAERPKSGPAAERVEELRERFEDERATLAPKGAPSSGRWVPGDAPSLAARWAVELAAKAGTVGVIGVYPPGFDHFPLGAAMNKNLTVNLGNCNHRRYLPELLDLVVAGLVEPRAFITQKEPAAAALEAYESSDRREDGWLKTVLSVT